MLLSSVTPVMVRLVSSVIVTILVRQNTAWPLLSFFTSFLAGIFNNQDQDGGAARAPLTDTNYVYVIINFPNLNFFHF